MYRVPEHLLDHLKCHLCHGYLSVKPLMIGVEGQQICGKCYNLLPDEDKNEYVRQVGLETLAQIFVFPCRYNVVGCTHTIGWFEEKEHESECPYSSVLSCVDTEIFGDYLENQTVVKHEFSEHSNDLKVEFHYNIQDNRNVLVYKLKIQGNGNKKLNVESGNLREDIEISINGSFSLINTPQPIYTELKINPTYTENIYQSLSRIYVQRNKCVTCKMEMTNDNRCSQGHACCDMCKDKMCASCIMTLERTERFCRNYDKGCTNIFSFDNIHNHQSNCEYKDIICPLSPCNTIDVLRKIRTHLIHAHHPDVSTSNSITKTFSSKDNIFVLICHDGIFKCTYYYYKAFVEFSTVYIGSSVEADKFRYEISISFDDHELKKKAKCANWNNSMVEKGIMLTREELLSDTKKKLSFEAHIAILCNY